MKFLIGMLLLASAGFAQGPRILIVTDLEGAGGVNDPEEQLLPGQRRYMESRHILDRRSERRRGRRARGGSQ